MSPTALEVADVGWAVEVLERRREPLVALAPVFWRPAADASARQREFLEYLLTEAGARGFRTRDAVLIAAKRGEEWLVDDMHVSDSEWSSADGPMLWNALADISKGEPVRFVCPVYEEGRAAFAETAGLAVAESWWLVELTESPGGGEPGVHVNLAGTKGLTMAAPPVYDPGGPVLYVPALSGDSRAGLAAAVMHAPALGCSAIVVNQVADDASRTRALIRAGLRRHCDYYTGTIHPI